MTVIVRTAGVDDLPRMLALYRELRPHDPVLASGVARDAWARIVSRDDIEVVVCEVDATLAATCMLATIPNLAAGARPFGVIEHVITLASHRRRGFARQVLERALASAWARGCYKVMLLSGAQRGDAHELYESVGFVGDVERGFVAKPPQSPAANPP
jgi:GNAT superfamily N-acetyltransferase